MLEQIFFSAQQRQISSFPSNDSNMDAFMKRPVTHIDFETSMGTFTMELYHMYAPKVKLRCNILNFF